MKFKRKGIFFLLAGLVVPFVFLSFFYPQLGLERRLMSSFNANDSSLGARKDLLRTAERLIIKKPLTGIGLGNFNIASAKYLKNYFCTDMAHNMFLQFGAESGIPSMIILLFIIVFYYMDCHRIYRCLTSERQKGLLICTIVSFTGLLISSQFGDPFVRSIKEYFAILLAFPYAMQRVSGLKRSTKNGG